ncbi:hypothetical protein MLD38_000577 [Melastoma candidum]|uniref:Uncharacterized protein n=1 Tax=Melastoma candidum TaxID=119954 RepID=A0ACB9SA19_9MYRT|nr:hypothetical protein MLD38_000577 [Melastoma candidum]
MEEAVILLNWWASPFGTRVKIALSEKGVEYENREEDLFHNKSPLLLKSNPIHKSIPVLIHNDKPVCESLVILQYIDETWCNKSPLMPCDPYERARARFWADFADKKLYSKGRAVWEGKAEDMETAKKELMETLKLLEGELGEKQYFGGERFGYADVAVVPFYSWFYSLEKFGELSIVEECPKLVEWGKRCMLRPSVCGALPPQDKVYNLMLELKGLNQQH